MNKSNTKELNNVINTTNNVVDINENTQNTNQNIQSNSQTTQHIQNMSNTLNKKRFQVEIFDKITYGEPPNEQVKLEKVHYDNPVIIEATCKKDLQEFAEKLALCKQTFKIVKVLDDIQQQQSKLVVEQNTTQQNTTQQNITQQNTTQQTQGCEQKNYAIYNQNVQLKQKPKYYKVGDVELKDDNGKIYQKQWLRLTEAEAANFRVINDKNNSIFNLKDRHIEMKKWVLVDSVDETIDLEDTLN